LSFAFPVAQRLLVLVVVSFVAHLGFVGSLSDFSRHSLGGIENRNDRLSRNGDMVSAVVACSYRPDGFFHGNLRIV
jgi:hypothetical protein